MLTISILRDKTDVGEAVGNYNVLVSVTVAPNPHRKLIARGRVENYDRSLGWRVLALRALQEAVGVDDGS